MNRFAFWIALLAALPLALVPPLEAQQTQQNAAASAQKLINANCLVCHGVGKSEGDLRLDQFASRQWDDFDLFDEILARVEDGEMPPDDAKKPISPDDKSALLTLLKPRLTSPESARLAGKYKQLTAIEYSTTLEDVFGQPIKKLRDLPFDSDNDLKKLGEHQVVTSCAVQKHYDAAQTYLDELILHEPIVAKSTTYTAANGKDLLGRQYVTTAGALGGGGNEPIFILRNPVRAHVEEGEYELTLHWHCFYVPSGQRPDLKEKHEPAEPIQSPAIKYFLSAGGKVLNPLMEYKADRQVLCDMAEPIRIVLDKEMKFLSFRGPGKQFRELAEKDPRFEKISQSDLDKDEKRTAIKALQAEIMRKLHGDRTMWLLITGATFRGPLTQNFTHQWLGLHKFGDYTPNEAYMPSATFASLQPHMAREPQEFFNEILYNNLSALNFIDSDFVVWNRWLYGLYQGQNLKVKYDRDVGQDKFHRMELTQNPQRVRGGLPTMASIMSRTTDGENTQPILRGVWVARRMLGTEIEPPATVPAIEINLEIVNTLGSPSSSSCCRSVGMLAGTSRCRSPRNTHL